MSDHSLIDTDIVFDIERDRNRSLKWRIILPTDSKIDWQDLRSYAKNVHTRIEIGLSHEIIAGMALNEKVAGLLLPDLRGSLDFNSGFISSSLSFCKWCQDLFGYVWNGSEKTIHLQANACVAILLIPYPYLYRYKLSIVHEQIWFD